jgi:4-alpha-glucanotransferase
MALKNYHGDSPWFRWPAPAKKRNKQYLLQFEKVHASEIEQIKWNQFIADRQWQAVRQYCKSKQVKLFGDLPFYVSYDSVDVWANPEYFSVDDNGLMTGVAGVPPDYFSADGQHWGVPTYNWEKISADNYQWWAARLKRNLDFFDVVRIDHFRALATYWQIPAGETTARNGSWLNGPGLEFFRAMEQQLGKLPFIAEDLGYEMEDVYRLREECGLPGMKVLQFAWGNNMSKSVDIPHNFPTNCVVYTGTHDNNTTRGWYEAETDKLMRQQICEYAGCTADADNIHEVLARMAYASVAEMAILPYQDLTGLAAAHRMNTPGTITGNWQWRMKGYPDKEIEDYLMLLAKTYNRI